MFHEREALSAEELCRSGPPSFTTDRRYQSPQQLWAAPDLLSQKLPLTKSPVSHVGRTQAPCGEPTMSCLTPQVGIQDIVIY